MEITYRFLDTESDSEISQWLDLYSVCFQQEITRNFWDYIHLENPFYKKTKPLIFIAQADGKVVGSLSAIPSPLAEYPKHTVILYDSLLICKGMVHPEYQRKGIFGHLLKNALKTAESEEYDFVLTISNNFYSYQSFIRNGFHDIAAMRWSRLFLSRDTVFSAYIEALRLPSAVKKLFISSFTYCYSWLVPRKNHSYQIKYGDALEFIEEIENFYASTHRNEGLYGCRTADFNRWKFREGVSFKCFTISEGETMIGYAIVQLKERNAYIIDIGFSGNKKKVRTDLIGGISATLRKYNFQTIWTYMVENDTILSNFFTFRNGFFIRSSKAGKLKKSRLLVYPLKNTPPQQSTLDKNMWNIQAVDTCLFLE